MKRLFLFCWVCCFLLIPQHQVAAQFLIRGPYLQMGTDTEITVRWRTTSATDGWVDYGTSVDNLSARVEHSNL